LTISTTSCPSQVVNTCFLNGDGIVVYNAGTTITMSTPGTPTVTASVDGGVVGSGWTYPQTFAGATTYSYKVVAKDKTGAVTAASVAGSTTTGNASLGLQSVAATSSSRSGRIVTVTTSAAHNLTPGATGSIYGTNNPFDFDGWFVVDTVPDNTHFTYTSGMDANNGPVGTSTTGGTVTWFNVNHVTWAAVTGAWEYCVYGRSGGSFNLLGCSRPNETAFDDYGPNLTGVGTLAVPAYVPLTAPSVAQNDYCTSTISSGAGTVNLTLSSTCPNTVAGATVRFDNGPNVLAAMKAAVFTGGGNSTSTGGNMAVDFPSNGAAGTNSYYVINSYLTPPNGTVLSVRGPIILNDTYDMEGADLVSGGAIQTSNLSTSFSNSNPNRLYVGEAFPGFYVGVNAGNRFMNIGLLACTSGYANRGQTMIIADEGIQVEDSLILSGCDNTGVPRNTDYGIITRGFQGSPEVPAGLGGVTPTILRNVTLFGDGRISGRSYTTTAPVFMCVGCTITKLDNINLSERGIANAANGAGPGNFRLQTGRIQGGGPPLTIFGNNGTVASVFGYEQDSVDFPIVANLTQATSGPSAGQALGRMTIEQAGCVSGADQNAPQVSGRPFAALSIISGIGASCSLSGQNINATAIDAAEQIGLTSGLQPNITGTMTNTSSRSTTSLHFARGQRVFVDLPAPSITATAAAGGCITGGACNTVTSYYFYVSAVGFDGGIGPSSPVGTPCVTSPSNQTCNLSWTTVSGAAAYVVWETNNINGVAAAMVNPGFCLAFSATTTSYSLASSTNIGGCAQPPIPLQSGGGANYMSAAEIGALEYRLTGGTSGFSSILINPAPLTANRTFTLPDASGTVLVNSNGPLSGYDPFNRASLNTGGPCSGGSCWTVVNGNTLPSITSNAVTVTVGTSPVAAAWTATPFNSNQFTEVTVTSTGTGTVANAVSLLCRSLTAATTYYTFFFQNGNFEEFLVNAGVGTQLGTNVGGTLNANDVLRMECSGNTITGYQNGVQVIQNTDSTLTAGQPGFRLFTSSGTPYTIDNINVGNLHPIVQADQEMDITQPLHVTTALTVGNPAPIAGALIAGTAYMPTLQTTGSNGGITATEGTGAITSPGAGADTLFASSAQHSWVKTVNGGSNTNVVGIIAAGSVGDCVKLTANGIDVADASTNCSVANNTVTVGTSALAANSCYSAGGVLNTATSVTMTGLTTTMTLSFTPNADISGVTGWGATGGLVIRAWPTANTANIKICNQTSGSITPSGSVTFNISAR
jgi:hypothetical protein